MYADSFNQPLAWDTSKVKYMSSMFRSTFGKPHAFNKPLCWDTRKVRDFDYFGKCDKLPRGCTQSNPTC